MTDTDGDVYYPDTFIEVAENSGLILALGRILTEHVCRDLSDLLAQGLWLDSAAINLLPLIQPLVDLLSRQFDLRFHTAIEPGSN